MEEFLTLEATPPITMGAKKCNFYVFLFNYRVLTGEF